MRHTPPVLPAVACATLLALAALHPTAARAQDPQDQPASEPAPTPAAAEEAPARPRATYRIQRTRAAIDTDGALAEEPWQGPPTFTLEYEVYPGDNTPPLVETEFWITFDDRNLYVAARAHDPDPSQIRARLRDRDRAFQDDFVGVVLDTFNDEARAFEFFVNPLGVQMDLFQNEVTGGEDSSWDTIWDSAGRLTESGYEVEMAIPFSSIRFPRADGVQTWGVDAVRVWPRDLRRNNALSPRERGRNCYLCQTAKLVGVEGVSPGLNLELAPTVTANQTEVRATPSGDFEGDDDFEPGLTARWSPTPNLTLNAAVNPDFSQVEADAAQLTVNTQFALSFPEKRPFFLEGADIFQTRIGVVDTRTIVDPDWGIKASGKEGKHAFGAIVAQDSRTSLIIPSSQFSRSVALDEENTSAILRYRRDLPRSSYVGGIYTGREGEGYHNRVAGIDSLLRWGSGDAFRIELLSSDTLYPGGVALAHGQDTGSFTGHAARLAFQRIKPKYQGYLLLTEIGEGFRGDLGFFPQSDFRSAYAMTERYLYGEEGKDWYSRLTWGLETTQKYDHDGNGLQRQIAPYVYLNGPRQSFFQLYLGLGDRYFAGKQFDDDFVYFTTEAQVTGSTYLRLQGRIGEAIDFGGARQADIVSLTPSVRLDLGRHLRLELSDIHQTLDVEGGRLFTIDLAEVRATYQLNVRSFVRLISQYQDLERDPALYSFPVERDSRQLFNQLLFSYKLNPQTVLFLGYSDGYFGGDPSLDWLEQSNRTLFAKVGYAFVW